MILQYEILNDASKSKQTFLIVVFRETILMSVAISNQHSPPPIQDPRLVRLGTPEFGVHWSRSTPGLRCNRLPNDIEMAVLLLSFYIVYTLLSPCRHQVV